MRARRLHFVFVILCLATGSLCKAQGGNTADTAKSKGVTSTVAPGNESAASKRDTIPAKKPRWQPNPKKAGLYAALLPGSGQIYNRQYWKLPIVYAGLGVAGFFIVKNSKDYTDLRQAYVGRISAKISHTTPTDQYVSVYTDDQLKQLQDDQNRILNMTIVYSSLAYAMQILDAVTSAHLRNFDISRDISLRIKPTPTPYGAGIGLAMNF